VAEPRADVELIAMVHRFLVATGVRDVVLRVNSLGDAESRPAYRDALVKHFGPHADTLGETDRRRLETNPLRLLDSKDPAVVALAKTAPSTLDHLSEASKAHFDAVLAGLTSVGVPFEVDPRIVRGLDYYTRTTFEFVATTGLGSQATVAGGGRYDGLVEGLGGPKTPAIGFALGLERLAILLDAQGPTPKAGPKLFLGVLGDAPGLKALELAEQARAAGIAVEVALKPSNPGNQLKRANRLGAVFAAILGDGELSSGSLRLKHMASGEETVVAFDALVSAITSRGA